MLTEYEIKRAEDANLVELPKSMAPGKNIMPGANCENCIFFKKKEGGSWVGPCSKPEVNMTVRVYWWCKYWANLKTVPVSEKYKDAPVEYYAEGRNPWTE
jgi:hypothetical protein